MDKIPTCRAAHLIPFLDVLRDIGAPVDRELERAKLPTMIEEMPDELISNILHIQFNAAIERREGIDDLGWLAASRYSRSSLNTDLRTNLTTAPTVKARLDRFAWQVNQEASTLSIGIAESNGMAKVFCEGMPHEELPSYHIPEWFQVHFLIDIVRSIMGKSWSPDEIRFKSDFSVCDAAREAHPNTRFLSKSTQTSIIMPSSVLAASQLTSAATQSPDPNIPKKPDGIENMKRLIRPYLREGAPQITMFAEFLDVSPRSLQRKLQQAGTSFSELTETTRFEMAAQILADSDTSLIDVAMTLGYENQSNFGRSFRRVAGISPGRYRREMFGRERAV